MDLKGSSLDSSKTFSHKEFKVGGTSCSVCEGVVVADVRSCTWPAYW
jgi:hypothetical protein